jgi:hypothetical protein
LAEIPAKTRPDTVYLVTKEYALGDRMSEFEVKAERVKVKGERFP